MQAVKWSHNEYWMIKLPSFTLFKINMEFGINALKKNSIEKTSVECLQEYKGIKRKDYLSLTWND